MDRLGSALKRTKRHDDYLVAVLFLDLDRFKMVNDSLGHLAGDQLLMAIARCLESCLRPEDTVARLGGDEFTILLENIPDISSVAGVVERIQDQLIQPFNLSGQEVFISASIGIALSATSDDRSEDLLRDADIAMYRAKALGEGRYRVFDATMHTQIVMRWQLSCWLTISGWMWWLKERSQVLRLLNSGNWDVSMGRDTFSPGQWMARQQED